MYAEQLLIMSRDISRTLNVYREELAGLPDGELLRTDNRSGRFYYHATHREDGSYIRRGITRKPELVNALARKRFLRETVRVLEHNAKVLKRAREQYRSYEPQVVIAGLGRPYDGLPVEAFFDERADAGLVALAPDVRVRIESHESWGRESFRQSVWRALCYHGRRTGTTRGKRRRC